MEGYMHVAHMARNKIIPEEVEQPNFIVPGQAYCCQINHNTEILHDA